MSAQTHESAPVIPLPEEMQQAERHLQVVNPGEAASQAFASEIITTNQAISGGEVPTYDQLVNMGDIARVITKEDGTYNPIDGVDVDPKTAESFLHFADAATWELTEESKQALTNATKADHMSELTADQKEQVKALKTDVMEPDAFAFKRFKESAAKRLKLGEEIATVKAEAQQDDPNEKSGFKVRNEEHLPDWAKLERPEGVEYKDWIKMNLSDRQAAVTAAQPTAAERVADIVNGDKVALGRRPDGKFMSKAEVEAVAANEDLIRDSLPELEANESKKPEVKESVTSARPESIPEEAWNRMTDDEKAMILSVIEEDIESAKAESNENEGEADVFNASPKGLRARTQRLMESAKMKLLSLYNRADMAMNDEEKGSRRRKILGGTIGAVLLTGVAYATYKGVHGGGGNGNGVVESKGNGGHAHGLSPLEVAPAPVPKIEHLQKGGTVWGLASHNLGGHPTNTQIFNETQRILNLNHISWEQAHRLAVGTEIKL